MPIPRPVTKTKIATVSWGIPMTDAVNKAVDTDIPALQAWKTANTPTAWVNLTLTNGWVALGAPHPPARYSKTGDLVYVMFGVKNGSNGVALATLPSGFRPVYSVTFMGRAGGAPPTVILQINSDGTIVPYYPAGATTDLCAASVIFPIT